VIVCGDLVHASPVNAKIQKLQVAFLKTAFDDIDSAIPLLCLCGNHDVGDSPTVDTIASFRANWGDDFFVFWVGGVKCIVLNTSLCQKPDRAQAAANDQLKWLRSELEQNVQEKPTHVLAFGHIPPFLEKRDEAKTYFNWKPDDRALYLEPMKRFGVSKFFCGHYHRNSGGHDGSLEVVTTAAVGCNMKAGRVFAKTIGTNVSGFRVVTVSAARVTHQWFTFDELKQQPGAVAAAASVSVVDSPGAASATVELRCRASGCSKCAPGVTHYCKVCGDKDSTHRSASCPQVANSSGAAAAQQEKRCRAAGCNKCAPGCAHYCKICGNTDSTHCSSNCPQKR
jgi:serine/threonine-protein phosphatase CPPED1